MKISSLVVAKQEDVDELLLAMNDRIKRYGNVTVGDIHRLVDDQTSTWEDERWGWTSSEGFTSEPIDQGFQIRVPAPISLKEITQ